LSIPMTTTATHAGFISDIIEHPDDDSIRLIYADYLEDHGDPERAAMVRMGRHTEIHVDSFGRLLSGVMNFKQSMVIREMIAELTANMTGLPSRIVVRRGFIAEVHAPLAVLEKHLPALVRQHPIGRVRVTDKEPALQTDGAGYVYTWWKGSGAIGLPNALWDILTEPAHALFPHAKDYPAADAAHAALSEVMLRLAKER